MLFCEWERAGCGQREVRSARLRCRRPLQRQKLSSTTLKTEDQAGRGLGAVLIGVEIAGAHGVSLQAKRPTLFKGQVNAAAEFVCEGMLDAGGRLGSEVRIADQAVRPKLDSFFRGPTEAWTTAAEQEPGANIVLVSVDRCELTIDAEPIFPVIDRAEIEPVHSLGDTGQFEETLKGVTAVELPGVGFENAGYVLRGSGRRR